VVLNGLKVPIEQLQPRLHEQEEGSKSAPQCINIASCRKQCWQSALPYVIQRRPSHERRTTVWQTKPTISQSVVEIEMQPFIEANNCAEPQRLVLSQLPRPISALHSGPCSRFDIKNIRRSAILEFPKVGYSSKSFETSQNHCIVQHAPGRRGVGVWCCVHSGICPLHRRSVPKIRHMARKVKTCGVKRGGFFVTLPPDMVRLAWRWLLTVL